MRLKEKILRMSLRLLPLGLLNFSVQSSSSLEAICIHYRDVSARVASLQIFMFNLIASPGLYLVSYCSLNLHVDSS